MKNTVIVINNTIKKKWTTFAIVIHTCVSIKNPLLVDVCLGFNCH